VEHFISARARAVQGILELLLLVLALPRVGAAGRYLLALAAEQVGPVGYCKPPLVGVYQPLVVQLEFRVVKALHQQVAW